MRLPAPRPSAFRCSGFAIVAMCLGLSLHTAANAQEPQAPPPAPSAAIRYLRSTLHIHNDVAECVASLNRSMAKNRRYDRLVQLDRYVIHASVRHNDQIFSVAKPVPVDTTVTLKGSARVRGQWVWQSVTTRCGLRHGRVVAISVEPRRGRSRPSAKQRFRPNGNYVDGGFNSNATT